MSAGTRRPPSTPTERIGRLDRLPGGGTVPPPIPPPRARPMTAPSTGRRTARETLPLVPSEET